MQHTVPFRLAPPARYQQLAAFNAREEIRWFGFNGAFEEPGVSTIRFAQTVPGMLGGGGTAAVNGGVIAAGFDAVLVLAGLGHYETDVVVTLDLSVQFLSLARDSEGLVFRAGVTRSARHFAFVEAELVDLHGGTDAPLATSRGMVAPRSSTSTR
ncbi:PaaI family thioesterase [Sphaerotilaceae bacterium SBD11-9]